MEFLKQKFSDFNEERLEEIKSRLEGNKIAPLYFNEDGTWKEDASVRLALALYGEEEISNSVNTAAKDAKSDALLEVINAGNKKPPAGGSGAAAAPSIDAETKKMLDWMGGGQQKNY